jgi:hypothetical protein
VKNDQLETFRGSFERRYRMPNCCKPFILLSTSALVPTEHFTGTEPSPENVSNPRVRTLRKSDDMNF